jgi:hypothetical protein
LQQQTGSTRLDPSGLQLPYGVSGRAHFRALAKPTHSNRSLLPVAMPAHASSSHAIYWLTNFRRKAMTALDGTEIDVPSVYFSKARHSARAGTSRVAGNQSTIQRSV